MGKMEAAPLHHRSGQGQGRSTLSGWLRRVLTSSCGHLPQLDGVLYAMATGDLDETVNLVEKTGRRMIARHADVRDRKALQAAFDDGVAEFGYIDTVVAKRESY